jgi:hypothetical protein
MNLRSWAPARPPGLADAEWVPAADGLMQGAEEVSMKVTVLVQMFGLATALALLLGAVAPQPVSADGMVVTIEVIEVVEMPAQKAILVYDEKGAHEDLVLSIELLGGSEAAWVVPVPSLPEVKAASPDWFEQLSELTAPKIETVEVVRCEDTGGIKTVVVEAKKEVVTVLRREQVGIYDVSILSATESGPLLNWLNKNGYTFPEEGGPLLDTYVKEGGWYFVAARVLPGESDTLQGDVQPLWFSFNASQPVYPMRLTALMKDRMNVLIYVLADHRMQIAPYGFETKFAGDLQLQPLPEKEAGLGNLLTSRPYYVTKLSKGDLYAPAIEEDLYPQRASSDEAYRDVILRTKYVCPVSQKEAPTEGPCVTPALLGLLAGLAVVWRRARATPSV